MANQDPLYREYLPVLYAVFTRYFQLRLEHGEIPLLNVNGTDDLNTVDGLVAYIRRASEEGNQVDLHREVSDRLEVQLKRSFALFLYDLGLEGLLNNKILAGINEPSYQYHKLDRYPITLMKAIDESITEGQSQLIPPITAMHFTWPDTIFHLTAAGIRTGTTEMMRAALIVKGLNQPGITTQWLSLQMMSVSQRNLDATENIIHGKSSLSGIVGKTKQEIAESYSQYKYSGRGGCPFKNAVDTENYQRAFTEEENSIFAPKVLADLLDAYVDQVLVPAYNELDIEMKTVVLSNFDNWILSGALEKQHTQELQRRFSDDTGETTLR